MIGRRCATTLRKLPITRPKTIANATCTPAGKLPKVVPKPVVKWPGSALKGEYLTRMRGSPA